MMVTNDREPNSNDDMFHPGVFWYSTNEDTLRICTSNATGAATWKEIKWKD